MIEDDLNKLELSINVALDNVNTYAPSWATSAADETTIQT
jgi:hypothetical protein